MLVIPSGSRHCSMAKEHLQADGQPPETGAGAGLSRASTRGRVSARARGATAMLGKKTDLLSTSGEALAAVVGVSVCVFPLMKSQ